MTTESKKYIIWIILLLSALISGYILGGFIGLAIGMVIWSGMSLFIYIPLILFNDLLT